jgi:hypothetical protein
MTAIPVREELIRSVEKLAQEQGTNAEALVNEWIQRQLALAREQHIRAEAARYRAQHSALLPRYAGQYIAMRNGEVLDHDPEIGPLYQRMRAQYGDEPVLITPVTSDPMPVINMRSPRRADPPE